MPGGDYRDELRSRGGWAPEPGPVFDADGTRVGEHDGAAGFTVGQRKGLGVALGEPRYVSRIDPATNAIVLGRREDLETRRDRARGGTFVADDAARGPRRRTARGGRSGPRCGSATARRSSTRRSARRRRGAGPRRPLGRRDRRAGVGDRARPGVRPVRRRRGASAAGGSRPPARHAVACGRGVPAAGAARDHRARAAAGAARRARQHALYVLIRGDAGGRLPLDLCRRGARRVGRGGDRRPAGRRRRSRSATSR